MDHFSATHASALPSAGLPGATACHVSMAIPGELISDQPDQPVPQSSLGLGGRQLYSKEQWDAQKQFIWRLYNQENKPFKRVMEILRTEHNFVPTRRQFYRKINEWGFEKNIKEIEMRAIAENLENGGSGGPVELKGRQIDTAKIQRWQKRQGRMKGVVNASQSQLGAAPMDDFLTATDESELSLPTAGNLTLIPLDSVSASPMEAMETPQNLNIWATVNVPGSPLLSRLFEALEIECPTEIPPISIGSPIAASAQSYLADTEMEDISKGEQNDEAVMKRETGATSLPSCSLVALGRDDPPGSQPEWNLPSESFDEWAFSQWDFSKRRPHIIGRNMWPMRPISPFPVSPSTGGHGTLPVSLTLPIYRPEELEMEETYYKTRLRSCKRIFGIDDPRTVEVMTRLANIYRRQSKYHEREYWLRHIALSMQRTHGFKHRRTLSAYFAVVGSLQFQGKCRQAAKIHQLVHAAILSLIGPEDELTLESSITMSDICNSLREYEEADGISRRILQMRLATLGPRHIDSLRAMRRVASVLNSTGKLLEAEQLLGIVLQLQHDIEDFDEHIAFFNEYELARVLRYQGRYSESKILVSRRAEQSEISFGPEYRETLLCYYQIAMCLAELEQYTESESLLQRTLERQLKRFGISDVGTIETMYSLAKALEKRGHSQEAANYFEKCFTECAENYGLEHFVTIQICDKLGRCYERLGRYEDALSLYQRTVDQLRTTNTDDHPSIVRIRGWIDELRDILAARQEGALNEQGETGVYGVLSNDGGSVEEGSATTSEDWMNDFVDFQTPKEDAGGGSI